MDPEEIKDYMREDIRRTLDSEGVPQHEQAKLIERHLAHWLACQLSSMLTTVRMASDYLPDGYGKRQLWTF